MMMERVIRITMMMMMMIMTMRIMSDGTDCNDKDDDDNIGSGQNQGWSTFPSIDGSLRPPWHSSYFDDNDDNDNKIYHERFKTLEILCMIVETMTLEILLFTIRMTIFY